ncbi:MAG: hypothetical protein ACI4TM_00555 [Candidatus Cryptobacteroides sp.]
MELFIKNPSQSLNNISGHSKEIARYLRNPDNPIYQDCKSFDDICRVVEDNCKKKLSGDSCCRIAAEICDKKGINPDDSCYDAKMSSNGKLARLGITSGNAASLKPSHDGLKLDDISWKLFLVSNSNYLYQNILEYHKKA